jgi:uncharacterized membrane protein HdeD (DUF308 family)
MAKLVVLLLGASAVRRWWWLFAATGIAWAVLGLLIVADASDGVTVVLTETFGYLLVVEGLVCLVAALCAAVARRRGLLLRALVLLVLGLLIIDMPWRNDIANSMLFGLAFLADSAVRIVGAVILRHARWKLVVLGGAIEFVLAALAFSDWPVSYQKTVPFCLGVALVLSGATVVRLGRQLWRLREGASVTELPLFRQRGWHLSLPLVEGPGTPAPTSGQQHLIVHVWTPTGSAQDPRGLPLVGRYVAAIDHNGLISTGHAALEFGPDLYISHYPAREVDHSPSGFRKALRATVENDVPGRFLPSYPVEVAGWCEADTQVVFPRFNAARLRAFWETYRTDDTYNLTNRNCSIVVAVALDAALEGVLGPTHGLFRFLRLIINPDLWLAALIRARGEAMTWTPGLLLDYAQALGRVVEPPGATWLTRFVQALHLYRASRSPTTQRSGT